MMYPPSASLPVQAPTTTPLTMYMVDPGWNKKRAYTCIQWGDLSAGSRYTALVQLLSSYICCTDNISKDLVLLFEVGHCTSTARLPGLLQKPSGLWQCSSHLVIIIDYAEDWAYGSSPDVAGTPLVLCGAPL